VHVVREQLVSLATYLRDHGWPYVTSASGVDWPATQELEMVYFFTNLENQKIIIVKTRCPYNDPVIPSLCSIFMSTNFHEREAYDLFGIRFPGHIDQLDDKGNLPRLLLPDDWPQYESDPPFPFRKEYVQVGRPFEKVTDTRGFQGERWPQFSRAIDRSGWLDKFYNESSDPKDHTLRANIATEVKIEEKKEEKE
jgi:NADH:ubiquinone oxidoreductase subunit C